MIIYRTVQWMLVNGIPFNRITIYFDSQAAIRFLSNVVNNSRVVRECRRCLHLLSERFGVTLVPEHSSRLGDITVKLTIARNFFRDANLSWVNEETCSTARLTWPSMDRRSTNQLRRVGRYIISITMTVLTGDCVIGNMRRICISHLTISAVGAGSLRKRRLLSTFYVNIHVLRGTERVYFGFPILISLTELLPIDVQNIASFIKSSGWSPA